MGHAALGAEVLHYELTEGAWADASAAAALAEGGMPAPVSLDSQPGMGQGDAVLQQYLQQHLRALQLQVRQPTLWELASNVRGSVRLGRAPGSVAVVEAVVAPAAVGLLPVPALLLRLGPSVAEGGAAVQPEGAGHVRVTL